MDALRSALDLVAVQTGFSGVVRVDEGDAVLVEAAYGLADRAEGRPNTSQTRFALASGAKGLTALMVMSLVTDGLLRLDTPARSLLGDDLPLIAADVTVEQLLCHRSGIGDYLDEDSGLDIDDHLMPVPVHRLDSAEAYLPVLDGHPAKFPAGEGFSYCNGGYVVLAILAERSTGTSYAELVETRVCRPAGMTRTAFLRSDELPGGVARGYVGGGGWLRTNVLHLPVLGVGDGGVYSTVADVRRLWHALFAGAIVPAHVLDDMLRARSWQGSMGYGLGFRLPGVDGLDGVVQLNGWDAGVSFRSTHDPRRDLTVTVVGNTAGGAWPVVDRLEAVARTGT